MMVWGYAIVWFFINDGVKLLSYRKFDPPHKPALLKTHAPAAVARS
ncbi:MAG: hypothetical protein QNK44_07635 [Hyphomicrobiaceae bacterium]|nr:hypothetical protein [Hyphomicrobiaceae bacterium]